MIDKKVRNTIYIILLVAVLILAYSWRDSFKGLTLSSQQAIMGQPGIPNQANDETHFTGGNAFGKGVVIGQQVSFPSKGMLTDVNLYLKRTNPDQGLVAEQIVVQVFANTANNQPNSVPLATGYYMGNASSSQYAFYNVHFESPASLEPNAVYYIVIKSPSSTEGIYNWGNDNNNTYGGKVAISKDFASSWLVYNGDMIFKTVFVVTESNALQQNALTPSAPLANNIDINYDDSHMDGAQLFGGRKYIAQQFTPTKSGSLKSIAVYMKPVSGGASTINLDVVNSTSDVPSQYIIAQASMPKNSEQVAYQWVIFNLYNPLTVVKDKTYYLIVSSPTAGANSYSWAFDDKNGYGKKISVSDNAETTWTLYNGDMIFRTYLDPYTPVAPPQVTPSDSDVSSALTAFVQKLQSGATQ